MIRCIEGHYDESKDDFVDTTYIIPTRVDRSDEMEDVREQLSQLVEHYGKIIGVTGTPGQPYTAVNLENPGAGYSVYVRFERVEGIELGSLVPANVSRYYFNTGR